MIRTYWHQDDTNFGDTLTPWLLARYGHVIEWASPSDAALVGVGSVLDFMPQDFPGFVWGTGLINREPHPLPSAHVLGVRGRHTANYIGHSSAPLGDPGLLLANLLPGRAKRHAVGVVPHKIHLDHPLIQRLAADPDVRIIDPRGPVESVAAHVSSCATILSTSLHGLITADSYGIPATWANLPDVPLWGGGHFKFFDHETSVTMAGGNDRRMVIDEHTTINDIEGRALSADREMIETAREHLERTARGLAT